MSEAPTSILLDTDEDESLSAGEHRRRKKRADRGKYAEGKVRDELKAISLRRDDFDFERNYDGRSSMGRIPRRAGDFTIYSSAFHGLIEVKSLAHDFRLPRKNFDPDKWAGLRRRVRARGRVLVVVLHTETKLWRVIPFQWFDERPDEKSWDLSEFRTFEKVGPALYVHEVS